jgi:AraC family transcriptional regulator of adaptative response / DNA-3-methyladenine glycosylase II
MPHPAPLDDNAHYPALQARVVRFDGRFFTGVTSTGIYCRPVCKVRTPRRENCRFFALAAQAELAGFQPCLRCRPELAPRWSETESAPWSVHEAAGILAIEAVRLPDASVSPWTEGAHTASVSRVELHRALGVRQSKSPALELERAFAA